jgi:hypothetical protein
MKLTRLAPPTIVDVEQIYERRKSQKIKYMRLEKLLFGYSAEHIKRQITGKSALKIDLAKDLYNLGFFDDDTFSVLMRSIPLGKNAKPFDRDRFLRETKFMIDAKREKKMGGTCPVCFNKPCSCKY